MIGSEADHACACPMTTIVTLVPCFQPVQVRSMAKLLAATGILSVAIIV